MKDKGAKSGTSWVCGAADFGGFYRALVHTEEMERRGDSAASPTGGRLPRQHKHSSAQLVPNSSFPCSEIQIRARMILRNIPAQDFWQDKQEKQKVQAQSCQQVSAAEPGSSAESGKGRFQL